MTRNNAGQPLAEAVMNNIGPERTTIAPPCNTQTSGDTLQVVYRWPDGREEVRYERPLYTEEARLMMAEVEELQARAEFLGYESPYSFRFV